MKLVKMSLLAATLIASSAYAIDNVKVSGDAKLYYETTSFTQKAGDSWGGPIPKSEGDMFDKASSNGQAALILGGTADLLDNISSGVELTVIDTLGLENNLVGGVWAGNITPGGEARYPLSASNGTGWWVSEAWLAGTMGKTTAKIGRQYIDTPLAFTETWNIVKNSFTAAVLINQDIPDTTLVAAYVGQSNGAPAGATVMNAQNGNTPFTGYTTYNNMTRVLGGGTDVAVGGRGAYAVGAVNNSWKPLTVQGWYYDVRDAATAYWLQADLAMDFGLIVGAQYTVMDPCDNIYSPTVGPLGDTSNLDNSSAFAVMVGYSLGEIATIKAAYSQTDDKGFLNIQNTATGNQSKLYTEAWWNYGIVGLPGTAAIMLGADGEIKDVLGWFAQYNNFTNEADGMGKETAQEITLGLNKSFGPLDTSLAYVHTEMDKDPADIGLISYVATGNDGDYTDDRLQVYLTLNF